MPIETSVEVSIVTGFEVELGAGWLEVAASIGISRRRTRYSDRGRGLEKVGLRRDDEERRKDNGQDSRAGVLPPAGRSAEGRHDPAIQALKQQEKPEDVARVLERQHQARVLEDERRRGAHRGPGRAVDRNRALEQQVHGALSVRERKAQVLGSGFSVADEIRGDAVRRVGHQGSRIEERQLVRRGPAQQGVFADRPHILGSIQEFAQLRPVEAPPERQDVQVESLEIAELVVLDRGLGQRAHLALEGRREMLAVPGRRRPVRRMSASSGWPPGLFAGTNLPVDVISRVFNTAWTPSDPEFER